MTLNTAPDNFGDTGVQFIAFRERTQYSTIVVAVVGQPLRGSSVVSVDRRQGHHGRRNFRRRHTMSQYIFDNSALQASSRFESLEQLYDLRTIRFLEATGIAAGMAVSRGRWRRRLDCRLVGHRVGPTGHVLVTDIAPHFLTSTPLSINLIWKFNNMISVLIPCLTTVI